MVTHPGCTIASLEGSGSALWPNPRGWSELRRGGDVLADLPLPEIPTIEAPVCKYTT